MTTRKNSDFHFRTVLAVIWTFVTLAFGTAQGQTAEDFVASLIHQKFILVHVGDLKDLQLNKDQLHNPPGNCDKAVQVIGAKWEKGTLRLEFNLIGDPSIAGQRSSQCKYVLNNTEMSISGFAPDEKADALQALIEEVLMTPEQYLTAHGITLDVPEVKSVEAATRLENAVVAPKAILSVDPTYSEEARRMKYQGTAQFVLIVGMDGRVHQPRPFRPLGHGLDEMAMEAFPMWRFTPAQKNGKPVASEVRVEISFNLY